MHGTARADAVAASAIPGAEQQRRLARGWLATPADPARRAPSAAVSLGQVAGATVSSEGWPSAAGPLQRRARTVLSTTASYLAVASNIARQQAATAAEPGVKAATTYYLAHIGKVKTVAQFVNNYQLFSYAMKAYGLGDMIHAKGLLTKVLNGGVASRSALANTLGDPRYRTFAAAFNFAASGAAATKAPSATTGTADKYIEQTLEDNVGKTNKGVALGLYFKRNASSITSGYGILADAKILTVVQTAFGLSATSAQGNIDQQAALLDKVLKIRDLQDPAKVEKLVERFTSQYDVSNSSNVSNVLLVDTSQSVGTSLLDTANGVSGSVPAGSVLNLFSSGSTSNGVSSDLLLSLAKLSLGGS